MGVNSRTYKFALGSSLLEASEEGRDEISLDELAAMYAMRILSREGKYPQAPAATNLGGSDYLAVVEQERDASVLEGRPTEKLLEATVVDGYAEVSQPACGRAGTPHLLLGGTH
jgi:hypothetical protein